MNKHSESRLRKTVFLQIPILIAIIILFSGCTDFSSKTNERTALVLSASQEETAQMIIDRTSTWSSTTRDDYEGTAISYTCFSIGIKSFSGDYYLKVSYMNRVDFASKGVGLSPVNYYKIGANTLDRVMGLDDYNAVDIRGNTIASESYPYDGNSDDREYAVKRLIINSFQ